MQDMGKNVSFTVKVDTEIHQKLKLAALVNGKSMTELLTNWIQEMEINIPANLVIGKGPVKKKTITPIIKKKTVNPDEVEIQKTILKYRSDGMSFQVIADKLNGNGVSTLSGSGTWDKSTISKLMKKWQKIDEN
jgi:hypothetical protein